METNEAVVTVVVITTVIGVPMLGLTLRLALKPVVDAYVRLREAHTRQPVVELDALKLRVAALEAVLDPRLALPSPNAPAELLPAPKGHPRS